MNPKSLIIAAALAALCGCATEDKMVVDNTPRRPTTSVDLYEDGRSPDREFTEVAQLSYLGPREDELKAQRRFMSQAQKMGGNAILFTIVEAGQKGGGSMWGFNQSTAYVFKAKVIAYK